MPDFSMYSPSYGKETPLNLYAIDTDTTCWSQGDTSKEETQAVNLTDKSAHKICAEGRSLNKLGPSNDQNPQPETLTGCLF